MKTLKIQGYTETQVKSLRKSGSVEIFTGMVSKAKGKKAYSVTVQVWATGDIKVFTVESLKNVEHKTFNLA